MDKPNIEHIELTLTTLLLSVIEGDLSSFIDETTNRMKLVKHLTPEQKMLIDAPEARGYTIISKSNAIKMLSQISGLNKQTHSIGSDSENPLSISVNLSYIPSTNKETKDE